MTRVQATPKTYADNLASIVITFSTLPTVGNSIVVPIVAWGGTGFNPSGCTDNRGNTYQQAVISTNFNIKAVVYYCSKVINSTAPFTITVTPLTSTYMTGSAIEFSGELAIDQISSGISPSPDAVPTSGATPPLTVAESLLIAAVGCNTSKGSIIAEVLTPIWTQELEELSNTHAVGETNSRIITNAVGATPSGKWTLSAGDSWAAAIAAFKSLVSSGGSTVNMIVYLLSPGPQYNISQNVIYALPGSPCNIVLGTACERSLLYAGPFTGWSGGYNPVGGFIRCLTGSTTYKATKLKMKEL